MLLTVICVDGSELPVEKVEMTSRDKPLLLPMLVSKQSEVLPGALPSTYGKARFDGLYLLPVFMTREEGAVLAFLRSGARPLTVIRFPAPAGEDRLPPGLDFNWAPFDPSASALHKLVDEELPVLAGAKFIEEDNQ